MMEQRMEIAEDENKDDQLQARPYQEQLLQITLQKNTIIYLPTGAGKTFIALMAIKHLSKDLAKPLREGGRRSVFLVNTVVLAHQQVDCIRKATALKTSVYTGDMNVDAWRRDRWVDEFEENQVLVATTQIILDVIRHGYIKINDLNLIIFDECHHGRKDHPMHQLMNLYTASPTLNRPRIIGLTGMLLDGSITPDLVVPQLEKLENTFHATIATVRSLRELHNVLLYSTHPQESILKYGQNDMHDDIYRVMTKKCELYKDKIDKWPIDSTHEKTSFDKNKQPNKKKYLKSLFNDFEYVMKDMGAFGATIAIMSLIVDLEIKRRTTETLKMRQLIRQLICGAEEMRRLLVEYISESDEEDDDEYDIDTNVSTKLLNLILYLKRNVTEEQKTLIFVQRRQTAKCLYHVLKQYAEKHPRFLIRPDFMVGHNNPLPESIESILENKWNRRVIDRFKKGEINCIVASSVLEEGVDLQMCNLVISYDAPKVFRSYVQSKGRARMSTSNYVILSDIMEHSKLQSQLVVYAKINLVLKEYLITKAIDRPPPLEEDIDKEFEATLIPPYFTKIGARLESLSAVALLNRYCMTLPNDTFTASTVTWSIEEIRERFSNIRKFVVTITMPMQSTVKKIIKTAPMESTKLAKRAAAFQACVLLHQHNELNDNLMPINVHKCIQNISPIYFSKWEKYENDNPRMAGTKKQYRLHRIVYPSRIVACSPTIGQACYLHLIQIKPEIGANNVDDNSRVFEELLQRDNTFGILTSKPLPKLGAMRFFFTFGGIRVQIVAEPVTIMLSDHEQIERLRNFHIMLFRDLLLIWKDFLVNDFSNEENSYFVVPTANNTIDWDLVNAFQNLLPCRVQPAAARTGRTYKAEDFLHKVISPWYRDDQDQRYVVTKVHEYMTPYSSFPNETYPNYAAYFMDKYDQQVMQPEQFMIEVKGVTTHLNRLQPGMGQAGGSKGFANRGPELLIPELCHNYNFPGSLWLKATLLPSILHRFHYLLHAEQIRVKINGFVNHNILADYDPEPVIESMVKNPVVENAHEVPCKSIVIPDPEVVEPKKLDKSDFHSLTQHTETWTELEEPIDVNRKLKVYPFEIDYYVSFINDNLRDMSLDEQKKRSDQAHSILQITNKANKLMAITDVSEENRSKIDILNIKMDTMTHGPRQSELLAAITAASGADVFDMERLEVLGDSFLKFAVSIYLLQTYPTWHEGFLTSVKGRMVSNQNLCYNAFDMDLVGMLKVFNFNPKNDWVPPLMCVPKEVQKYIMDNNGSPHILYKLNCSKDEVRRGTIDPATLNQFISDFINDGSSNQQESSMQNFLHMQRVSDKTAADCIEAILGACVKAYGLERSFCLLSMFGILPPADSNASYNTLLQSGHSTPRLRPNVTNGEIDSFLINYRLLETSLGYTFRDRAYLLQALTHPSYPTNSVTGCYQQLEFLGDAVLDILVSTYIFEHCPTMNPGQLTDIRSALVNNVTLACLCIRYKFHLHILAQNAVLDEKIRAFVAFQEKHNHEVTEQVLLLIEEKDVNMGEYIDVPKTLGDIFEAIIGGIFLDTGKDLQRTWQVIYKLMYTEIHQFIGDVPLQVVRRLYEYPGANPKFDEPYVEDEDVMIRLRFTKHNEILEVQGFGRNKEDAKRAAAKVALHKLST